MIAFNATDQILAIYVADRVIGTEPVADFADGLHIAVSPVRDNRQWVIQEESRRHLS